MSAPLLFHIYHITYINHKSINRRNGAGTLRFLSSFTIFCCVYQGLGLENF
ncbi:Uncharacterised protein [Staphylococcus delphini]|nr:Uncharacterised protein [Staphylococcus delphini]